MIMDENILKVLESAEATRLFRNIFIPAISRNMFKREIINRITLF
jgi:hypothetical protein